MIVLCFIRDEGLMVIDLYLYYAISADVCVDK